VGLALTILAMLVVVGIIVVLGSLLGGEEKEEEPVRVVFRSSEVFELEKGEGIICETLGAKNGRWNASCLTNRYLRLKRKGRLICIPFEWIECLEYHIIKHESGLQKNYGLVVYSRKEPPHKMMLWHDKTNDNTMDVLLPEILARRKHPNLGEKNYSRLTKKLLEKTKELIEYRGTKHGPQVFVRGEFIRRAEKLLRSYFMAQIAGKHRWLRDIYINPVFLFTDWIVALTRAGTVLIRRQDIYFVYLERLFQMKSRTIHHYSRYDAPPPCPITETWEEELESNLTLYTLSGTYSFEDVNYKRTILYLSSLSS